MLDWQEIYRRACEGNPPPPRREELSESQWRARLSAEQYAILREQGTERPFSSDSCSLFTPGRYACAGCGTVLFDASEKFESGTGWPSFTAPLAENLVRYERDTSLARERVETLCAVCDGHLGHVFPDGPAPTGLRFCINALALNKVED